MAGQSDQDTTLPDDAAIQHEAWMNLPKKLFATFFTLDALFVLLYLGAVALHLSHSRYFVLVDLDAEANPPSWYSGAQLFLISIGYFMLASRLIPSRTKVRSLRPLWMAMGLGFAFLSMDEVGSIHERIGSLLYELRVFNHIPFTDQWMWVYVIIAIVLLVAFYKQLILVWREWRVETVLFLIGFVVLALGAFVLEGLHLWHHLHHFWIFAEVALEEGLEMLGATILLLPVFRVLSYAMTSEPDSQEVAAAPAE